MTTVPTFKDRGIRESFDRDGYAIFRGLATHLVPDLLAVYQGMLSELPESDPYFKVPMTGTNCIGSLPLRARILASVGQIIEPAVSSVIDNFRLIGAGFRVKQVGPDSELPLHQDPTQVDEERAWLMNIIVPIIDTNVDNGALKVVPGSHKIMRQLRSLDLEDRAETMNLDAVIEPLVETIPMQAGDAIFYLQSILHGSGPNLTPNARPLVLGTLMERSTPVTVYFRKPNQPRMFDRYEVPDNYFNQMEDFDRDHKRRPNVGRLAGEIEDKHDRPRDEIIAAFRALVADRLASRQERMG